MPGSIQRPLSANAPLTHLVLYEKVILGDKCHQLVYMIGKIESLHMYILYIDQSVISIKTACLGDLR